MDAEHETVIHVTLNAPWLPPGGRAEVIRRPIPPESVCVARLLLQDDGRVFCVKREDGSGLDLPMLATQPGDPRGELAIHELARRITGSGSSLEFVGAVRNVVERPHDTYGWPTPRAHFAVWSSEQAPVVEGTWLSILDGSPLRTRHWFPLVS